MLVIFPSRPQSSILDRRSSSIIVSTLIVSSIVFRPRQSRSSDEGKGDGGGGCIACDRNEEGGGAHQRLQPCSRRTAPKGQKKDAGAPVRMEDADAEAVECETAVENDFADVEYRC
jgi:hypothetical protein